MNENTHKSPVVKISFHFHHYLETESLRYIVCLCLLKFVNSNKNVNKFMNVGLLIDSFAAEIIGK